MAVLCAGADTSRASPLAPFYYNRVSRPRFPTTLLPFEWGDQKGRGFNPTLGVQCHSEVSAESRSDCFLRIQCVGLARYDVEAASLHPKHPSLFCPRQPRARFLAALGMTSDPIGMSPALHRIPPILSNGFVHGEQVLHGRARLNVVDRIEHKTSPCAKSLDSFANFLANQVWAFRRAACAGCPPRRPKTSIGPQTSFSIPPGPSVRPRSGPGSEYQSQLLRNPPAGPARTRSSA